MNCTENEWRFDSQLQECRRVCNAKVNAGSPSLSLLRGTRVRHHAIVRFNFGFAKLTQDNASIIVSWFFGRFDSGVCWRECTWPFISSLASSINQVQSNGGKWIRLIDRLIHVHHACFRFWQWIHMRANWFFYHIGTQWTTYIFNWSATKQINYVFFTQWKTSRGLAYEI